MRSDNLSLYDLFERQKRYVVPLFQRPYVWGEEEEWGPLWHDILGRAETLLERRESGSRERVGNHFLGAVVFGQLSVFGKQMPAAQVIDGQQRLTTLQVMLAAFRDVVAGTDERRLHDDLVRLTENGGVREADEEQYKVWPTNADRHDFVDAMTAGSAKALEEKHPLKKIKYTRKFEPRPRLVEAYLFFSRKLSDFCFPAEGEEAETTSGEESPMGSFRAERADAIYEAFRRHLQVVQIDLEEDDDPQVIFETLNARGVELLPSDLIRNFIFLRAGRLNEDADHLYNKWWFEYDERRVEGKDTQRFWKQMERQGRLRRTRLDLFFHHYLTYRSGQDLEIGHLFHSFQGWWETNPERPVEDELKSLRAHSDAFARLFVPTGESRLDTFATRLRAIDTSTVYPLLLLLLVEGRNKVAPADFDGILTDLESYLVRRMVCDLGTKNYNRFFRSLMQQLKAADSITLGMVQQYLLEPTGSAGEWPSDKAFRRAWLEKPAYQSMKAYKCSMVLRAIDESLRNRKQEDIQLPPSLTVEHVLPQGWTDTWPAPEPLKTRTETDEDAVERRNRLLQSLGNLTLLTQELNSTVSTGPYEAKRLQIKEQSLLRLNTYFQDVTTWNEAEIQKRGELLFEKAKVIWPRPE